MMASDPKDVTVREVSTYEVVVRCGFPEGCDSTANVTITCATQDKEEKALKAAESLGIGWANGLCPLHATQDQSGD